MGAPVRMYGVNMTFGGRQVYNPGEFYEECMRYGFSLDWVGKANSFTCPTGAQPGRGWLLMTTDDVSSLLGNSVKNGYELVVTQADGKGLRIGDTESTRGRGLYIVDAVECGGGGQSLSLVEIADFRAVLLKKPIFDVSVGFAAHGYRESLIRSATFTDSQLRINGAKFPVGTSTYQEVTEYIKRRWENIIELGPFPGMPDGFSRTTQQGWHRHYEVNSGIESLELLLNQVGCTLAYKVTFPFRWWIEDINGNYSEPAASINPDMGEIGKATVEDRSTFLCSGSVMIPDHVRVCFRMYYMDGNGPRSQESELYCTDISCSAYLSADLRAQIYPDTIEYIYDDMPAIYGSALEAGPFNMGDLQDRARDRASQFYLTYIRNAVRFGKQFRFIGLSDPFDLQGNAGFPSPISAVQWSFFAGDDGVRTTHIFRQREQMGYQPYPSPRKTQMIWVEMKQNMCGVKLDVSYNPCSTAWQTEYDAWIVDESPEDALHYPIDGSSGTPHVSDDFTVKINARFFTGVAFGALNDDLSNDDHNNGDRVLCLCVPDVNAGFNGISMKLYAVAGGTGYITGTVIQNVLVPPDIGKYAVVQVDFCSGDTRNIRIHSANVYGDPGVGKKVGCVWNNQKRRWETGFEQCDQ